MSRTLEHDWFPAALPDGVAIGAHSWVYSSYAFLHDRSRTGTVIGSHSGVYNGTFFDLGPDASVVIGDFCTIVGAIVATNGSVRIHDHAFIAHEVVIADGPVAVPSPTTSWDGGAGVVVGENAWIGARAVLLGGARIGRDAVVGAAAVVDGVVPDGTIAAGNPYQIVGSVR